MIINQLKTCLLVIFLFIIGAIYPSDGVDGAIEKSPSELLTTAFALFLIGAVSVVVYYKFVLKPSKEDSQKSNI
jgi:bacteriorhodopsin